MEMTFAVTGAAGRLGSLVLRGLIDQGVDPGRITAITRDASRAADLAAAGVQVRTADYGDPASLRRAFAGVRRAFIVSGHAPPMERAELHRNAFAAARRSAVESVVYTSFQGAAADACFSMGRDHHLSERYLRESGLRYAALRNSFYAETAHELVDRRGFIPSPSGDGRVAWVSRSDIAETAVQLLLHPGGGNEVLDVSGPEAPRLSEVAELLAELSGLEIRYVDESCDDGLRWRREEARRLGLEDWDLESWMSGNLSMGIGEAGIVSDTVERITGRAPKSLRELYAAQPELLDELKDFVS